MEDFDTDKMYTEMIRLLDIYSFKELMWLFRNITYDQVKYFSEDNKGVIYDGSYSRELIEQATDFQRKISTYADLMNQSISNHREFDRDYLKKYDYAGPYLSKISVLEETIQLLREEVNEE